MIREEEKRRKKNKYMKINRTMEMEMIGWWKFGAHNCDESEDKGKQTGKS